jgi:Ca-activated chloride channel family protein
MRRAAILAGLLVAASALTSGQQPTFRSDTGAVVSIFATVTDSDNRLVLDLTREDFEVLDNDAPQVVTLFENEARPISVVLMLDTSASMTANLKLLREAAEQFLIRLMPGDKAKVGAFNDKIEMSGHFTGDRDELISEVRGLDYGNATRLFDAAAMSLDELAGIEGRRVLVILSDGEDTSSRVGLRSVMERARDEEVMVYSIGLSSEYFDGQRVVRSRPDGGLRRLAEETGGGYFELKKTAELAPTFTRVAQELHSQYVLGFVAARLDNRVHKLTLRVKRPGMMARGRRSYLASGDDSSSGK